MTVISSIKNLGPVMEAEFNAAGIMTAERLHEMGADEGYAALLRNGYKAHFIGYYVLHMGLQGRPWNDCKGNEKKALRLRFDAIKAQNTPADASKLDAFMNEIGLIQRR